MPSFPLGQREIEPRISGHLDELLSLWWAEQGPSKPRDLELIASSLPFPRRQALRVLDLCCGPGDVGRAIRRVYPSAEIDCVDRDPFLLSICAGVNRRDHIPGNIVQADLEDDSWHRALAGGYDVVAAANALHWLDLARGKKILRDAHELLCSGGIFVLAEPVTPEQPFAAGFEEWKDKQPQRYTRENWQRFWTTANRYLGYDHIASLGPRNDEGIGDTLTIPAWTRLVQAAGFSMIDVLWRDTDQVIIAALR
jgi:tRNA (cmo5U34)-methyltransferase